MLYECESARSYLGTHQHWLTSSNIIGLLKQSPVNITSLRMLQILLHSSTATANLEFKLLSLISFDKMEILEYKQEIMD